MDFHGWPVLKRCQTHCARSDSCYVCCVCVTGGGVGGAWCIILHILWGTVGTVAGKGAKGQPGDSLWSKTVCCWGNRTHTYTDRNMGLFTFINTLRLFIQGVNKLYCPLNYQIRLSLMWQLCFRSQLYCRTRSNSICYCLSHGTATWIKALVWEKL